jgi:hypothetical protein
MIDTRMPGDIRIERSMIASVLSSNPIDVVVRPDPAAVRARSVQEMDQHVQAGPGLSLGFIGSSRGRIVLHRRIGLKDFEEIERTNLRDLSSN